MSLAGRAVDEIGEYLRVVVLWLLLAPAFAPADVAVAALPAPLPESVLYAWVPAVGAVAVVRYYDPSWDLLRAGVAGVATSAVFLGLYVFSDAGRAVDAGGSWGAFGLVVAFWLVALGVGVTLAHPRTWQRLRRAVAVG